MKRNPAYKGKWHAPLIDNPNSKGIWKPQEIPNPAYFELEKPDFEPIAAIGIEIWTMQDGILFDNILMASDEKVADTYRETTWKPKFEVEKEKLKAEEATVGHGISSFKKKIFNLLYKIGDIPFLGAYKPKIIDLIERGEKQPNITIGILASIVIVIFTIFYRILFGGRRPVLCCLNHKASTRFLKALFHGLIDMKQILFVILQVDVPETSSADAAVTSINQGSSRERDREDENDDENEDEDAAVTSINQGSSRERDREDENDDENEDEDAAVPPRRRATRRET